MLVSLTHRLGNRLHFASSGRGKLTRRLLYRMHATLNRSQKELFWSILEEQVTRPTHTKLIGYYARAGLL
jgi:hypothetical protein